MQPPLKAGELPTVTDTDPQAELHPATMVGDGYVRIDVSKLTADELAEVMARSPKPDLYTPPPQAQRAEGHAHEPRHHQQHESTGSKR